MVQNTFRKIAIDALSANPMIFLSETQLSALKESEADIIFEELGIDSLARMELSIWLYVNYSIELSEHEIMGLKSLVGLIGYLSLSASNLKATDCTKS